MYSRKCTLTHKHSVEHMLIHAEYSYINKTHAQPLNHTRIHIHIHACVHKYDLVYYQLRGRETSDSGWATSSEAVFQQSNAICELNGDQHPPLNTV